MNNTKVPGRLLAWTALLVALGASVLANVAYARPELGPRLSAGTAPVLTVLAAGLIERVPLGTARSWQRWLAWLGLGAVAAAAFITSYEHQYALLLKYGNPHLSAVLLPIAVDGLIVLASVCLAVIAERRRELSATASASAKLAEGPAAVQPLDAGQDVDARSTPATSVARRDLEPSAQVDDMIMSAPRQPRATRYTPTVAEKVARYATRHPDATPAVIAVKVGCTERTARRHLAALVAGQPEPTTPDTERVNGTPVPDLLEAVTTP